MVPGGQIQCLCEANSSLNILLFSHFIGLSQVNQAQSLPTVDSQGPSFTDHCPAATDSGPGLLEPFFCQLWTLLKWVAPRLAGNASRVFRLLDLLTDLTFDNFARNQPCSCYRLSSSRLQRLIAFFLFFRTCANHQRNLT